MKVTALAIAAVLAFTVSGTAQDRANSLGNGVAPMATTDPEMMIYRVAGISNRSDITVESVGTSFFCYSNSSVTEKIRFRILAANGVLQREEVYYVSSKNTLRVSTRPTDVFYEDFVIADGLDILQGAAAIIATSKDIYCSAMIVDADTLLPSGIALHMVRFNPAPGSVE